MSNKYNSTNAGCRSGEVNANNLMLDAMSPSRSRSKNAAVIQDRKNKTKFRESTLGTSLSGWTSSTLEDIDITPIKATDPGSPLETPSTCELSADGSFSSTDESPTASRTIIKPSKTPDRAFRRNLKFEFWSPLKSAKNQVDDCSGNCEHSSPSKHRRAFRIRGSLQWSRLLSFRHGKLLWIVLVLTGSLVFNSYFLIHKTTQMWDNKWAYEQSPSVSVTHVQLNSSEKGKSSSTSREKSFLPRLWHLGGGLYVEPEPTMKFHRRVEEYSADYSDVTQKYGTMDSTDENFKKGILPIQFLSNPYEPDECVPFAEWQTTHHPSCNSFHEMDLMSHQQFTLFGTKGYWRHAWKVRNDMTNNSTKYSSASPRYSVLKTLRLEHDYEIEFYHFNQIDAMVMERLTFSPFIMDIYGFCGNSALTEYASTTMNQFRKNTDQSSWERLKLARKIALGLEDIHGIDGYGNVTVVHNDLNPSNILMKGVTPKFNDFNIGELLTWNKKHNRPCKFESRFTNPQWRAPEECPDKYVDQSFSKEPLTEKIDIYGLGNIFYNVLTNADPWMVEMEEKFAGKSKVTTVVKEFINRQKKQGVKPKFTEDIYKLKDPALVAIRDVVDACFEPNPIDRPSARMVVKHLENVMDYIETYYDTNTGKKLKPKKHKTLHTWAKMKNRFLLPAGTPVEIKN